MSTEDRIEDTKAMISAVENAMANDGSKSLALTLKSLQIRQTRLQEELADEQGL